METATPSSTPEFDVFGAAQQGENFAHNHLNENNELMSPAITAVSRPVPWQTQSSIRASTPPPRSMSPSKPPLLSIDTEITYTDDNLPPTPPISPREDEESDCEEVKNLKAAISSTIALMRSPTSSNVKSILKERVGRTFLTPSNSIDSQIELNRFSKSPLKTRPRTPTRESNEVDSLGNGSKEEEKDIKSPKKKSVRWQLSEEQEIKETARQQLPSSPKIHRGNKIVLDESEDELMSARSDVPTPPLSPNCESLISLREPSRNLFRDCTYNVTNKNSPNSNNAPHSTQNSPSVTSSGEDAKNSSKLLRPKISSGQSHSGLLRSSRSSPSSSLILISRSRSGLVSHHSSSARSNTKANALIGTLHDPHMESEEPVLQHSNSLMPIDSLSRLPSRRSQSDAANSLMTRTKRKRGREEQIPAPEGASDDEKEMPATKNQKN